MLYGWDHHSNHHGSPHSAAPYSAGGPMSDWNFTGMQAGHGHPSHHHPGHQSHHNMYQPHHHNSSNSHQSSHTGKYVNEVSYHSSLLGGNEMSNQPVGMYMLPHSGGLN